MENNSQFEDHEKTKLDKRRIEELRDLEELTPSYGQLLKALDELSEEKLFTNGIFEACQKRGYNGRNDDYTALKKFIVEKAIINGIVNEDEKDTFGRSINNWIKERFRPDKDNIFKLCFALEMDELETREFILKKCLKRPFNYRRIEETIFYYCIMNGYNYAHAMKLKDILKSVISDIENCQNETLYTQQFSDGLWNINSDDEFIGMMKLYSQLNPLAIYVVDSWGTMYSNNVLHYLRLADDYLDKEIAVGFHGHNNLMQAFGNAVDFLNSGADRELIIDGSVYGIGRGAGNLHSEIIAKYLNEYEGKNYHINSFWKIYEKYIKEMKTKYTWGFTPAYYMSATYHANPQYGTYYGITRDVDSTVIDRILRNMPEEDRVLYTKEKAEKYYLRQKNS